MSYPQVYFKLEFFRVDIKQGRVCEWSHLKYAVTAVAFSPDGTN